MLKLLRNLNKKDILFLTIATALVVLQVFLELKMPDYMSEITVLVQTPGSQMGDILKNGEYMLACAFASLLSSIVVGYITANFAANLSLKIRKNIREI